MKKQSIPVIGLALSLGLLGLTASGQAGQTTTVTTTETEKNESFLTEWWNGKYATGNWFGVRDTLEEHGLKLGVEWKGNLLWNVDGGKEQGTTMRSRTYTDTWEANAKREAGTYTSVLRVSAPSTASDTATFKYVCD